MTEIERLLRPIEALQAAKRLKAILPVRKRNLFAVDQGEKRNKKRPVIIKGIRYPSLRRAANAHSVAGSIMLGWLASGKAKYAED